MQNTTTITTPNVRTVDPGLAKRSIERRSFGVLATTSPSGRPHAAGVLYEIVDDALYINTLRTSRKARNIASTSDVGICVPVRRIPVGPPSTVHFQAAAELVTLDDPRITALLDEGRLRSLTSHGELELADGCFVRVPVPRRLLTYGLGMPLLELIRDPLAAGGVADLAS